MQSKFKILENMIRNEVRKQMNEESVSVERLIGILKNNPNSGYGSLFYIDEDNKIIYSWPEDRRLIKPAIKAYLTGLIKAGYEYKSKDQVPSRVSKGMFTKEEQGGLFRK